MRNEIRWWLVELMSRSEGEQYEMTQSLLRLIHESRGACGWQLLGVAASLLLTNSKQQHQRSNRLGDAIYDRSKLCILEFCKTFLQT
jgi:hypothetical protein